MSHKIKQLLEKTMKNIWTIKLQYDLVLTLNQIGREGQRLMQLIPDIVDAAMRGNVIMQRLSDMSREETAKRLGEAIQVLDSLRAAVKATSQLDGMFREVGPASVAAPGCVARQ